MVMYLFSELLEVEVYGRLTSRPCSVAFKNGLSHGCSSIIAVVQEKCEIPGLHIDFSKTQSSMELNAMFTGTECIGLLEGKHYQSLDSVVPFKGTFPDCVTGYVKSCPMT